MVNYTNINKPGASAPAQYTKQSHGNLNPMNGVYLAKVVENADPEYQGHIYVEVVGGEHLGDNSSQETRRLRHKIRPTSPFGGSVQGSNYGQNYGSQFPPPSPGSEVLVAFTGRDQEGFFLGVMPDANRNAQVPGVPTSLMEDEDTLGSTLDSSSIAKQQENRRPRHPLANAHAIQGIGYDAVRGPGSSGGRRESPMNVSGFLTPGGHGIVMDDGTTQYREGENYVPDQAREEGKNNLIRIRSGSGAQFLINDSVGIVYIINQGGTSWVQMDSDGNVDIYAQGSVSMHSEEDFNFHAGNGINIEADTINIKSRGGDGIKMQAASGGIDLLSNTDLKLTSEGNTHLNSSGNTRVTAGMIDLNGPAADTATAPTANNLTTNRETKESVAGRVPEHEPWGGHDEGETIVAAQAPSTNQPTATDYDLSALSGSSGPGSSGIGSSPIPAPRTSSSTPINPRSGGNWA